MKRMMRLAKIGVLCLICLWLMNDAHAEEVVKSLLQSAYPAHMITVFDQCGGTTAAVLTDGTDQLLCLAEETNGTWEVVLSNPAVVEPDREVRSLLLDTEETLFWNTLDGGRMDTWHASKTDGTWRVTGWMAMETHANGNISEYHLGYENGRLHYSTYLCDENENIQSYHAYEAVPAAWLEESMALDSFDAALFPKPQVDYTHSWLNDEATARAAAELFPQDTFLDGCASRDHLEFFLQRPNGDLVAASCRYEENAGWRSVLSTPLPEGTFYGYENFSSSFVIGNLLVGIGRVDDRTCGVTFIYNDDPQAQGERMFSLGRNWVCGESPNGYHNCFGDHPWDDITVIDWTSLPHTLEEAVAALDTSSWAVVSNPNPQDRLHLRVKPERGAKSLGKYYNGTPVRVLEQKGDWAKVSIFGVEGWMMKEYLAFGDAGHAVEAVFPSRMAVAEQMDHYVYASPEAKHVVVNYQHEEHGLLVLGIVGEEWYHAWFPDDGLTGYVLQSDWWEGNG